MNLPRPLSVPMLFIVLSLAFLCTACGQDSAGYQEYLRGLRAEKGEEGNTDPLDCFNRAIQLDPTQASYYQSRAGCLIGKGELDKALADYNKAISLTPQWSYLYYARGLCKCQLHDYASALSDFETAIKGQPSNTQFYSGEALAYLGLGKLDNALASIDKAASDSHAAAQWHYQRGMVLTCMKRQQDAIMEFGGTEALTLVGAGNEQRRIFFDGGREFDKCSKLTPDQLVTIWVKPLNVDYYRDEATTRHK